MSEIKVPKNLRLTPKLLEEAERICDENSSTVPRLVDRFLAELVEFEAQHGELRKFKLVSKIEFEDYQADYAEFTAWKAQKHVEGRETA